MGQNVLTIAAHLSLTFGASRTDRKRLRRFLAYSLLAVASVREPIYADEVLDPSSTEFHQDSVEVSQPNLPIVDDQGLYLSQPTRQSRILSDELPLNFGTFGDIPPLTEDLTEGRMVPFALIPGEAYLNAKYAARAAIATDSTRISAPGGAFLPSAIPVQGQQFYGSALRSTVLGTGSAFNFRATAPTPAGNTLRVVTNFQVQDFSFDSGGDATRGNIVIQQAYGQFNTLLVGVAETAFANPRALPEVIDIAGPNARITAFAGGSDKGQARMSFAPFSTNGEDTGFTGVFSLENPTPEIRSAVTTAGVTGLNTSTFARVPDVITTLGYSRGEGSGKDYLEYFNFQLGSVFRSLGLENDSQTFEDEVLGWGVSLSTAIRFHPSSGLDQRDGLFGSVTYGEGISHYVVDLQTPATNLRNVGNDAMLVNDELAALPVLAWYGGYTHNWTESLRSTVTYSQVSLESVPASGLTASPLSPYRVGDFVSVNLVFHEPISGGVSDKEIQRFYTGLEYLYGNKETLDGSEGSAHRVMWAVVFAK